MKQLIQSYKTGELGVYEVPAPICGENGVLVRTITSLVSAGTEKMIVDLAKKSLFGKAKARPDLVKQVVNKMKQEGVKNTLEKVFTKLDTPIPLGYSCVGEVVKVGAKVTGISVGDRVACGGAGYANHSEINYVPRNLFVKVPKNVSDADASFVTVGSIALQGIRQTNPTLGEKVVVMGLGLLGQITVQLLKANGCKVLGTDFDPRKLELAKKLGADEVCSPDEVIDKAKLFTNGNGADAVVIAASTSSSQPIADAGEISRIKGRVIVVGLVGMDIPRTEYYKKELELKLSMAYGPGRYDPKYEEQGIDYPFAHVRWTEGRNFEAFLDLVDEGKITPSEMVTHEYEFENALTAYDLLEDKIKEDYLGILLNYKEEYSLKSELVKISDATIKSNELNIGLIGAGNFTKSVIIPNLKKIKNANLVGLCTATGVSAHSTGNKHNFKYITTDYQELLKNNDINTVFITTRHNDHGEKVLTSLKADKNVFVEKPLAILESELEEIKDFYANSDKKPVLQVGYNRRFAPLVQAMKKEAGDLPMSINYRVNAGVIPKDVWVQDPAVGGGRIIGEACHFIDTCTFLIESLPESVFASCVTKPDQSIPDEDNVSITIKYQNGSTAVINYYAFGNNQLPKEYIELFAPDLAMTMDNFRELEIFKGGKSKKYKNSNQDKGFKGEFTALKTAVEKGELAISFDEMYSTSKLTFAILRSLKTGELQKL
ncbi:MAG: putative dehydrogenase/threonine dehydrogenase-like Zn-dependent dehydrogenase [Flavobacteriales bacterium]|jgi:predicted dehydrogenase/threonine dehydrogenase-like Zn-dependent dehydrogenase|tara:strand:+ start:13483 stop:15627 length:2145 start_codon:yes stop_codon:yes gene_type:complete